MKEHNPADEVESQKHGQAEGDIDGNPFGTNDTAMIGEFSRPEKVMFAWYRVDGANGQFEADLAYPLPRHGDPPVVGAVVDQEQLQNTRTRTRRTSRTVKRNNDKL